MKNGKPVPELLWEGFEVHGWGELRDYRLKLFVMKGMVLVSAAQLNFCL